MISSTIRIVSLMYLKNALESVDLSAEIMTI